MKIVSWNVDSLRARLPRVQQLLAELQPEVLLLQETKCDPAEFCTDELTALGYESVHHSAGRWAGVAILARAGLQLRATATGLPGELREDEARWIEATIDPPDGVRTRVISA